METRFNAHVPEPAIEFDAGTPHSVAFGDVYFSRAGGVAETEYVFLRGNGLPERWLERPRFTIGEIGFGTGLNFLVAWKRFCETAPAGAVLHYLAVERYPLPVEILRQALAQQPELAAQAEGLLKAYPLRLPGVHRLHLERVVLTLYIGDVAEMLPQMDAAVDAWFLDGFSPAKNPDMWREAMFARMAALSAPGARVATFTAAAAVRRGLEGAGFKVQKVPGFGHKRDMLVAEWAAPSAPAIVRAHGDRPVLVIGAGIAGATVARALAERGQAVTVLEQEVAASGASGNAAGVLFPQLTKQWGVSSAWHFHGYGFMLRQLRRWQEAGLAIAHGQPGMVRLPRNAEEAAQLQQLEATLGIDAAIARAVTREEASAIAGVEVAHSGAYYPQGTWLSPTDVCHALLQHERILLRNKVAAKTLRRVGEGWEVETETGEVIRSAQVCVASAAETRALLPEHGLRLNMVGGQVSEIRLPKEAAIVRSILCRKGYLIPRGGANYLVGATYHREEILAVMEARHAENVQELSHLVPAWFEGERFIGDVIGGRSAIRATTPDRMPYVGAVAEGLYVSAGHGSRGLIGAPLAAEVIASAMLGEATPVSDEVLRAVRPTRFS